MPEFFYRAVNKNGETRDASLKAENEVSLEAELKAKGWWLIEVKKPLRQSKKKKVTVNRRELIEFFNNMLIMTQAGITVSVAVEAQSEECENEGFRQVLSDMCMQLESGENLVDAMNRYPKIFPEQVRNLIKAGEFSGNLEDAFEALAKHLEWVDGLMNDIKQASIYPVLITFAVMGLIGLLFTFVVPRFKKIFDALRLELPAVTQSVIDLGEFAQNYWWLVIMIVISVVMILKVGPKFSPKFANTLDQIKLDLPVFGKLNSLIVMSRFTHNFSLLLRAGVPILDALKMCRGLVGNHIMATAILDAEEAVSEGKTVSDGLRGHTVVTPIVLRMMVVGEQTGRLDQSMSHISRRFDQEIPRTIKKVFAFMEPAIMLVLISVVGVVAMAIFLPLLSIMSGIH